MITDNDQRPASVLKALMLGLEVELAGTKYLFSADYRLCVKAHNQHGELVLLVVDFGDGVALKDFVGLCFQASDREMMVIGADIVLNEMRERNVRSK